MLIRTTWLSMAVVCLFIGLAGCDKNQPADKASTPAAATPDAATATPDKPTTESATKPADPAAASPAGHPTPDKPAVDPHAGHDHGTADATKAPAAPAGQGGTVELTGLTMTAPASWQRENVQPSPMGPVAVFKIKADAGECEVRITHYESMKGKDDMNINRWLGMVVMADGQPYTREKAQIKSDTVGDVKLTVVDLPGTVNASMGGPEAAIPDGRMIAAIIDHSRGPHYVRVYGPAKSMTAIEADVQAFLKSAKASPS
jgi:hypothetical protein